jgi:hypothetical protein
MDALTDIPRSVHPDILSPLAYILDKPGTVGRSVYNAGRIALAEMRKACTAMRDAEDGFRRHNGLPEELLAAADRFFNRTARTVNLRMGEMKALASILAGEMAGGLNDPPGAATDGIGIAIAQTVRTRLRSLSESECPAFIARAIDADDRTVAAAPAAPPLLSGMGSGTLRKVSDQAARRWASVKHQQAPAIEKAIEHVMTASNHLALHYAKVLDLAKRQRTQEIADG